MKELLGRVVLALAIGLVGVSLLIQALNSRYVYAKNYCVLDRRTGRITLRLPERPQPSNKWEQYREKGIIWDK